MAGKEGGEGMIVPMQGREKKKRERLLIMR